MNIMFWANSPCIRTYKQAKALRSHGVKTVLAFTGKTVGNRYPGLCADDAFDKVVSASQIDVYHFVDDEKIDVIHTAHPPDDSVRKLCGAGVPVVHDFHDMYSLEKQDALLLRHEADAARYASGLVYVTESMEAYARETYPNRAFSYRTIANAADDIKWTPAVRPWPKDELHIVYVAALPRWDEGHFRDMKTITEQITAQGVHLHVHAIIVRPDIVIASQTNPLFHLEPASVGAEMIGLLSRYDAGIWHQRSDDPVTARLLNMCSPNKLYEYWQAQIPVICIQADEPRKVVTTYRTGWMVKSYRNIIPLFENRPTPTRQAITMREEVTKLISLYEEIL